MICKVIQAAEKFGFPRDVTVTVGLSGGADSVALLDVLLLLSDKYGLNVKAAHINHCLRGDQADSDEAFVRRLCEQRNVHLDVLRADVAALALQRHIGLEECGRQVRYEFFSSLDTDYTATAHTLSDAVETMFINLSRGCSLSGLCSIPPVRDKIIRPLILCTGDEVRQYCNQKGLEYVVDSSNNEDEYLRNKVRHHVVPQFEKITDGFFESAGRCIDSLRDDSQLIDNLTNELMKNAATQNGYSTEILLSAHISLLRRAVYKILYEKSGVMPERKHIDLLITSMQQQKDCQLCGSVICSCKNGCLTFPEKTDDVHPWCIKAKAGENLTPYSRVTLMKVNRVFYSSLTPKQRGCLCFDGNKITGELVIRSRKAGDRLTDSHRGNTKTLKKLFTESKIPSTERNSKAIVADGDNVIAVEGFCVDKKYTVDKNTENIIYLIFERM